MSPILLQTIENILGLFLGLAFILIKIAITLTLFGLGRDTFVSIDMIVYQNQVTSRNKKNHHNLQKMHIYFRCASQTLILNPLHLSPDRSTRPGY